MRLLAKGKIVQSTPGIYGGYLLLRSPGKITLREIYEVLEGGIFRIPCWSTPESCSLSPTCSQRPVWFGVEGEVLELLSRKTLEDFLPQEGFVPLPSIERKKEEKKFSQKRKEKV
jgi:DNA-binding IscR family transcriptional regulator